MKINTAHGHLNITIDTRRMEGNFYEAQRYLDQRVIRDSEPYVPFDRGVLRNSAKYGTRIGNGQVIYKAPYAHYQYEGDLMVGVSSKSSYAKYNEPKEYNGGKLTYHTPGTGPGWFEVAKAKYLPSWIKGVKERVGKK
ncbi:MAG: hypothetical protein E7263_06120 [Lachnospiraceae bacterium]|nr:hypothetical protein [Lachnospiraceae bacterium]